MSDITTLSDATSATFLPRSGWSFSGLTTILRPALIRAKTAHTLRHELSCLPQEIARDSGLCPEDVTGISTWQPDLPFFMQNGFGRR